MEGTDIAVVLAIHPLAFIEFLKLIAVASGTEIPVIRGCLFMPANSLRIDATEGQQGEKSKYEWS
jgi:hypothetical protein